MPLPQSQDVKNSVRESHVQSQMARNASLVEELSKSVSSLESRLSAVLRDNGPECVAADKPKEPKPYLVSHAQSISNMNDQLDAVIAQLANIRERLEL